MTGRSPHQKPGLLIRLLTPLFAGTGRSLMRPHHRRINTDNPFHRSAVVLYLYRRKDLVPRTVSRPPPQPLMRGLPRPITLRNIPPRRTRTQLPQDRVDHHSVITPPTTTTHIHRQHRRNRRPSSISQLTTTNHTTIIHPPQTPTGHALTLMFIPLEDPLQTLPVIDRDRATPPRPMRRQQRLHHTPQVIIHYPRRSHPTIKPTHPVPTTSTATPKT